MADVDLQTWLGILPEPFPALCPFVTMDAAVTALSFKFSFDFSVQLRLDIVVLWYQGHRLKG